jgi:type II secretory pathway pseudopilin PulG
MSLQGQDGERGFAMAALLVSLAVMSVLMSVALPTWRHQAQREKEAELIFRGEQYARAVALFRAKNGNNFPASVDILVRGKYLRKKYLDPITGKDFEVIGVAQGQAAPGAPGTPQQQVPASGLAPGQAAGGIMGVRSRSDATSIRIYNNQNKYNLWTFTFTAANRPGGNFGGEGSGVPGGRGGAQAPGGRGGRGGGPTTVPGGRGAVPPGGRGIRPDGRGQGPGRGLFPQQPPGSPPGAGS